MLGFSFFEKSGRYGKPITLYEFSWGPTIWRYTSADRNIEFPAGSGDFWAAIPISDEGFTQGPQAESLTITLPSRLEVCQLFRSTPPSLSVWINVKRFHRSDPDQEAVTYWVGTVGNVKRGKDALIAQIVGLSIDATIKRVGLRDCWERGCPYSVYDGDCRADKELFKTVATITAIEGTTITVDTLGAFAGAQYNGGFFEWVASTEGTLDRRGLEHYLGANQFNLLGSADRLTVGLEISMYLGCDLTPEVCDGTFDNLANHGGLKFLPGESPFDGRQLFY
jgi:uncharacterized phage protein (TIGR02218 family)